MNALGLIGLSQMFLAIYLILHGIVHSSFLDYKYDERTKTYTGWSGHSWVLSRFLKPGSVIIIGKISWAFIIVLFIITGLGVLDLPALNDFLPPLISITSLMAILAFIIFFDGLAPRPYQWILGVLIDIVLIFYVSMYPHEGPLALTILAVIALSGLIIVVITIILPELLTTQKQSDF